MVKIWWYRHLLHIGWNKRQIILPIGTDYLNILHSSNFIILIF